jgi:hypothetical protein
VPLLAAGYAREEIAANYCAHRLRSYEYVADLPGALDELHRVLRLGGRAALVLDTDWDSLVWDTKDRELNRRITAARDEHLVHPHLPKVLARLLRGAGFTVTAQRVHVLFNTELTENSFSAFDMRAVAKYVPGHHGMTEADAAALGGRPAGPQRRRRVLLPPEPLHRHGNRVTTAGVMATIGLNTGVFSAVGRRGTPGATRLPWHSTSFRRVRPRGRTNPPTPHPPRGFEG